MSADKWTLAASRNPVGCLVEPEDSEHDSEEAARAAWANMDPDDYMDAFIFPPRTIGGKPIILKHPGGA